MNPYPDLNALGRVIDVSVTLRKSLAPWPGEDFWSLDPVVRMSEGAPCNVSKLSMGCHFGTHADAPWHFGKSAMTMESIPLNRMVIMARVLDLTHVEKAITRADLEGRIDGTRALLFKTRMGGRLESGEPFDRDFVHLDASAADYLMEKEILTLGVDYCSVDGFYSEGAPVHNRILKDIFVIESLDFTAAEAKDYLFIVLPLKIEGSDGAPARAVLIDLAGKS